MILRTPRSALSLALLFSLGAPSLNAEPFIYEGSLVDLGQPANGRYDLRLSTFAQEKSGNALSPPTTLYAVDVQNGRFRLDFDLPVNSETVWLGVEVRPSGESVFSALNGRSKAIAAPLIGQCWSTLGDSSSDPGINFIGTTDAQPFVVRTQNVQSFRIEPSTILFGGNPITTNTVAGSSANNIVTGVRGATIAGGGNPSGDSDPDFLAEGPNRVSDHYGAVLGGYGNVAGDNSGTLIDSAYASVGGGRRNIASGVASVVAGGFSNDATGGVSTVAGGENNEASGAHGAVSGGASNTASGLGSFVGSGFGNTASGLRSGIVSGVDNNASGNLSSVAGGSANCAGGFNSWAAGTRAKIRPGTGSGVSDTGCAGLSTVGTTGDEGVFAWADSQAADLVSTGDNQFLVRAQGGIYFGTNSTVSIPSGRFINTSTGGFLSTGGTWTNASSRSYKTDFAAIDPTDVLNRVAGLDIGTWRYRNSTEGRHLGPIAEEFFELFGLGTDAISISTVDANGVALAAIQGLNAKLEAENAALRARLDQVEARLNRAQ